MNSGATSVVRVRTAGDRGLLVEYGEGIDPEVSARVRTMDLVLAAYPIVGVEEVVPTYRSLLLIYDPLVTNPDRLMGALKDREGRLDEMTLPTPQTVEIPVCYGGEYGPDIENVARVNGLTVAAVIKTHCSVAYPIYMIGFTPGYPFMGGLPESLHTPRLETPRTLVPRGSVGIANNQTGIYPVASPGGWQLIGRTPRTLFAPHKENPFLFKTGDSIRFVSITPTQYKQIRNGEVSS